MAKRKSSKGDDTLYEVELHAPQPMQLNGDILEDNEQYITLRHKKPRSSKLVRSIFYKNDPVRKILAIYGKVGSAGAILYMEPYKRQERSTGTIEKADDGWLILNPENNGEPFKFNPETATVSGADEEANEKAKKSRQNAKQTQKSSAKGKTASKPSTKSTKNTKSTKKKKDEW